MTKEMLQIRPHFTHIGKVEDSINWVKRDAMIKKADGTVIFKQEGVEFPDFWSESAVKIVADKYFRGILGSDKRENSLKQIVNRVVDTVTKWGVDYGYFDEKNGAIFNMELKFLIYHQMYCFNSPVWFNIGIESKPQISACFIQSVQDNMKSIMELVTNEAFIFKNGSGSGTNFSNLRGKNECLSGGGKASGPLSFMKGYDAFAGIIKSGGKTRRAAKIALLDVDHLDIVDFIDSKRIEEEKALSLIQTGYSEKFEDENGAYQSVSFQNENHSVVVNDKFMQAVINDESWTLMPRGTDKSLKKVVRARLIFDRICQAAHSCGDPGLFFFDASNKYHTCPESGAIRACNPCAEFIDIDDSACNLASFNLKKFFKEFTKESVDDFRQAIYIATVAQEIIIDRGSYPTERIEENAKLHRQLGVGFSNLGALLMYHGHPYDSEDGRNIASCIASLLTGTVYETSGLIARLKGPFRKFKDNKDHMKKVLELHKESTSQIKNNYPVLQEAVIDTWESVLDLFKKFGMRNSKATVLAPSGTISFMMDCDTFGVEPELYLLKSKTLVGGGTMPMVNDTIGEALVNLGYEEKQVNKITAFLQENKTLDGCPALKKQDLPVFDTAYGSFKGGRTISMEGHVNMLAALQPFISGGISKTINLPSECTVEDFSKAFIMAYKAGLKAIIMYREDSKGSQPLNADRKDANKTSAITPMSAMVMPQKRSMPAERQAWCHGFSIGGHKIYLHMGFFQDGTLGEIFLRAAKEGSTMNGFLDAIAVLTSTSLQWGVPLNVIVNRLAHTTFEPNGYTGNKDIGYAKSIVDYVFRYIEKYVQREKKTVIQEEEHLMDIAVSTTGTGATYGPPCTNCGAIMVRVGTCYYCDSCFTSMGCS
jgi:ribonucleoside-diphosphate reductase alpha chain